jgi:hypothetical protein
MLHATAVICGGSLAIPVAWSAPMIGALFGGGFDAIPDFFGTWPVWCLALRYD